MRTLSFCSRYGLLAACLATCGVATWLSNCHAASFGINFSGEVDGWGPYYVNQVGTYGAGPYTSAFGVAAADWYEPGPVANTAQLPGAPTSVNFQPASMGAGSVDIAFASAYPDTGPMDGYTWTAFGFANANRYVMQADEFGNPLLDAEGHYIPVDPVEFAPDNGIPPSGEHAVLAGFMFAVGDGEYDGWSQRNIEVSISGLSTIATEYHVTLLASAQNGDVVEGFTPATISDNAANSDMVDFELLPEMPSYWSPFDPDPDNPFVSVGGMAVSNVAFTGDTLTIQLSGWNEYLTDEFAFFRTLLSGIVIDYEPVSGGLQGDYNNDGKVDAADYTVIIDQGLGQAAYDTWVANFGNMSGAGSASGTAAVPEPAAWSLIATAVAAALAAQWVRRRQR